MMFFETTYNDDLGLGFAPGIAAAGSGGPVGIAIAAGVLGVQAVISLFRKHKQREQREDQISGAWAASGPQAIADVMQAWRQCQIGPQDAVNALDEIERQYKELTTPIVKTGGKWNVFPDPNGPRPSDPCNWACITYWELHRDLQIYKSEIGNKSPCESVEQRAARKCANPEYVAAHPGACETGRFSPQAVAQRTRIQDKVSSTGIGNSDLLLLGGLALAAVFLLGK